MRGRCLELPSGELPSHIVEPQLLSLVPPITDLTLIRSPSSVEELQTALKVVNEFKIPVWTVSRGKNLG